MSWLVPAVVLWSLRPSALGVEHLKFNWGKQGNNAGKEWQSWCRSHTVLQNVSCAQNLNIFLCLHRSITPHFPLINKTIWSTYKAPGATIWTLNIGVFGMDTQKHTIFSFLSCFPLPGFLRNNHLPNNHSNMHAEEALLFNSCIA